GHADVLAVTREVLVDGIVHHFPHEVVQGGTVVNVPDVHAGALAHRFEPLENRDVAGIVARRVLRRVFSRCGHFRVLCLSRRAGFPEPRGRGIGCWSRYGASGTSSALPVLCEPTRKHRLSIAISGPLRKQISAEIPPKTTYFRIPAGARSAASLAPPVSAFLEAFAGPSGVSIRAFAATLSLGRIPPRLAFGVTSRPRYPLRPRHHPP